MSYRTYLPPSQSGCGCSARSSAGVQSWIDIAHMMPADPMELVAFASINSQAGFHDDSGTFNAIAGWIGSGVNLVSAEVDTLATDAAVTSAYADQWNMSHLMVNQNVAFPMRKVIFLRAGRAWVNKITIALGGAIYDDLELSFRDNAGTRGDNAGTVPVIAFPNTFTGNVSLEVTLFGTGVAEMGLAMRNSSTGDRSMFEMEWHIVE